MRLGTPYIELNAQGRARPELAKLYSWRYRALGDLPSTTEGAYRLANPGFAHESQFVDVEDYEGAGERAPTPYFYQNLGEAEYLVSVYQYMRLLGYPANKISIITTYRGQKHLIRDVVARRCASHPLFGPPKTITTVDKFQGQQNDYILLSMVRTKAVGHVRDVRRLVVAMSRARLGLYVFGRRALFEQCYELEPAFKHLLRYPTKLAIAPTESVTRPRDPSTKRSRPTSSAIPSRWVLWSISWRSSGSRSRCRRTPTQNAAPPVAPLGVMNDDEDDRGAQEYWRCAVRGRGSVTHRRA